MKIIPLNITLNHRFVKTAHDINALLLGCTNLSTFCSRLESQSSLHPNRYKPNKYKGDGFELFVEALIKLSPVDNRIGIGEYCPNEGQDVGVDGRGIGANGNPATVQVKYRGNGKTLLTATEDHLANFVVASILREHVDPEDNNNMLIITTAEGLHLFTDVEMFTGKVRCLGRKDLASLVDDNGLFWDRFRELCGVDDGINWKAPAAYVDTNYNLG